MRDLIERQAVVDTVAKSALDLNDPDENWIMQDRIKEIPSAQPEPLTEEEMRLLKKLRSYHNGSYAKLLDKLVASAQPEIIRCKDCKWKQGSECVRFADVRPFPDDFCSRAERRTDETQNT